MRERLQKILAQNGCGSRRDCEELIKDGRVSVDGKVVDELGMHVDTETQPIKVDGQRLKLVEPCYFLLNKPRGVICTMSEDEKITRAIDFAPKGAGRVHTIGRLDRESEGLIILTNDGDLTERLTHPRHDMPKTYHVTVDGGITPAAITKLRKGVWLSEGKATASSVTVIRHTPFASLVEIELREGKNREIRRILARVGYKVKQLKRIAIGPIRIAGLAPGKVRPLTEQELAMLTEAVGHGGKGKYGAGSEEREGPAARGGARSREASPAGKPATGRGPASMGAASKAALAKAAASKVGGPKAAAAKAGASKAATPKGGAAKARPEDASKARPAAPLAAPPAATEAARLTRKDLPAFEPVRIVTGKGPTSPQPAKPTPAANLRVKALRKAGKAPKTSKAPASPARSPEPRKQAPPTFPAPAAAPKPRYEPDADGVIVVRRPSPRAPLPDALGDGEE